MIQRADKTAGYDIAIIGGGVNGAGIARDASGRGYKVLLIEQDDLASHTSSGSSKLIHGGLRYLEFYEFKLVREALNEREVLLNIAPHIIWPLQFVLPHHRSMRPSWMIRAGLWLYDHLGKRKKLPGSKGIDLRHHIAGEPLKDDYKRGFVYSDCWVQDARLVVLNAMDARDKGAEILTRTCCTSARQLNGAWQLDLKTADGQRSSVTAAMLVNATGPWVSDFIESRIGQEANHVIRLVSGGHIIVPRLFEHDQAYIFQNPDKRIVFAMPYEDDYTLIGTTELDVDDQNKAAITDNEIEYLCDAVNRYFNSQTTKNEVVWHYTGVRPLVFDGNKDATEATREYLLELTEQPAPCLSVFGGKITTFRSLAENAMNKIEAHLHKTPAPWTAHHPLPGGDFEGLDFHQYLQRFRAKFEWLPEALSYHYVRNYGTRAELFCNRCENLEDLGQDFGHGLFQAEVDYLMTHEWVQEIEDLIWRRSKWGLKLNENQRDTLAKYIRQRLNNSD